MSLLAIDSTGKTTKNSYCHGVCTLKGWLSPIYLPGACLLTLIQAVVRTPSRHDTLCILSNANKVVEMNWTQYDQTARHAVWGAVQLLAEHIKNNAVSKHIILFGADVDLFPGVPFPDD